MELEDGSKYTTGNMYVSGMVTAGKSKVAATPNAAMFVTGTTTKTYYYTTLDKAISGASAAGLTEVEAMGSVSVPASIDVPTGMTVKQTSGTITIGSKTKNTVTVSVADGAKINQTAGATIDVKGTLYVANKNTGLTKTATVLSEVKAEGTTDVTYTNFLVAVNAQYTEPTTVILSGDVVVDSDLVIPQKVTVDCNGKNFTVKGAKLTIDGTLYLDGATYTAENTVLPNGTVIEPEVVVNGYMKSADSMVYNVDDPRFPAGAYYTITDSGVFNMITGIANSCNVTDVANEKTIALYGEDLAFGSIIYLGTKAAPAYINVYGNITSGSIVIDNAVLTIETSLDVNAEIGSTAGSADISSAKTTARTVFSGVDDSDGAVFEITTGALAADEADSYAVVFDDDVSLANFTVASPTVLGDVVAGTGVSFTGNTTIIGTLIVDNAMTMNLENVDVIGSFIALEATASSSAGRATLTGLLTVGENDISTASAALVSGNITAPNYYIYAANELDGAIADTIAELILLGYYTDFVVEDGYWLSVYYTSATTLEELPTIVTYAASTNTYHYIPDSLEDSKFTAWQYKDTDGKLTTLKDATYKVGSKNTVYAKINYEIYTVNIITDAGVKSVSIDGNLMTAQGNNTFQMASLKAGTHKVTYTLMSGYEGSPQLYTSTGTILQNNSFELSGTTSVVKNLQLSGTQKEVTPEPEPTPTPEKESEWNVTTILLLVLVILIAIMAVIVALRLNRS